MSFTYDPTKLSTSLLYQVRLKVGNTSQYDLVVVEDEEINFFLKEAYESTDTAAVMALDAMISRAGTLVDKTTGQSQENASQALDNLIRLRDDFTTSVARNTPKYSQFTGFFEKDRKEQQNDPCIYHDGITNISEYPETRLLNGPVSGVPGSSYGQKSTYP